MARRLGIEGFDFFVRNTRTRFPFRYGIASMTEVPHLFVRCRVMVDGVLTTGLASEGLPPKWFTKDPATVFEQDLRSMYEVIAHAASAGCSQGREARSFFAWWRELYGAQAAWGKARGHPGLLAQLGSSLVERAVLDGVARATGRSVHALVRENRLGIRLGELHEELGESEPGDWLPAAPSRSVLVRHTVGLADALAPGDLDSAERVDDGLPQDLESSIRAYRLRAFKVKLFGDPERDLPRLRAFQQIIGREVSGEPLVTLDGNENFRDFESFRSFWEPLARDPSLSALRRCVVLVEQPVHRDHALDERAGCVLEGWTDRPPLIIDESDGAFADLPRALHLGYAGASHKNCKGVVKGIANACLLAKRRQAGEPGLLTGEDLCNLGPVALLQDLACMALLGVPHVERNGHHYFRGLGLWPEAWQDASVLAHPDLYIRDPGGFARLDVRDGRLELGSVNAAPFGLKPLLDPEVEGFERPQLI